ENNGITFSHQFDKEATVSIGDVAVAPTDKNVVWVGTGEANPRNSVSYGDGVYKSTDGGKHWKNMGLKKSFQIGKILIHPKEPNTVYVGVLGRLYGPNEERGLYKTTDGGKSWKKLTQGLPYGDAANASPVKLGRSGLDWYRKDPNVVYAIIDSEKVGTTSAAYVGVTGEKATGGTKVTQLAETGPAAKAG